MESRKLGSQGLVVSTLGLGCMGMTAFYGEIDPLASEEANIELIGAAVSKRRSIKYLGLPNILIYGSIA